MDLIPGKLYILNKDKFFKFKAKRVAPALFMDNFYDAYRKITENKILMLLDIKPESKNCLELTFFVDNRIYKLLYFPDTEKNAEIKTLRLAELT